MKKWLIVICCWLIGTTCFGQSCQKKSGAPQSSADTVTVQVGSRSIQTTKYNSKGAPVVPMWDAPMPNSNIHQGAGFPVLKDAQHAVVWQPSDRAQGAYNHYAALIYYKGQFFAMWGNSTEGEDAPGQQVLYSRSNEWGKWSAPQALFPAPGPVEPRSEDGIHLKPDRWIIIADVLYSIVYVHGAGGIYPIARSVSENGDLGPPFLVRDLPDDASLPVFMQDLEDTRPQSAPSYSQIKKGYSSHHQISWWAWYGEGVPNTAIDGSHLIEAFTYQAPDGGLVLLARCWGHRGKPTQNNRLYVSFNDGQHKWTKPYPTDIPDAPSRAQALSLADGTVLLIGNQNAWKFDHAFYLDRDPLTVSVSKDGYHFSRVYALRTGAPETFRFSGVGGRNPGFAYPSAVVHDGWLYVLYSVGKEDMAISRVSLQAMGL